jgi:hypothetical protein
VPTVTAQRVDADSVKFTWTYPNPQEGDAFQVLPESSNTPAVMVSTPEWTWDEAGSAACVEVGVVRADRRTTDRAGRACG